MYITTFVIWFSLSVFLVSEGHPSGCLECITLQHASPEELLQNFRIIPELEQFFCVCFFGYRNVHFFFPPFRTINICLISLVDLFFGNSEDKLLQAKSKTLTCKKKKKKVLLSIQFFSVVNMVPSTTYLIPPEIIYIIILPKIGYKEVKYFSK